MKSIFYYLLVIMFTMSCVACNAPKSTDESNTYTLSILCEESSESYVKQMKDCFKFHYGNIDLEIITLSTDPVERDGQMTSIKTDIITGEGPDMFLLSCQPFYLEKNNGAACEPFFKSIEKNIALNTFLPLDEYIENSELFSLDHHIAPIMEAGRTDEGQEVLPLLYASCIVQYDKKMTGVEYDEGYTFSQIYNGDAGKFGDSMVTGGRLAITNLNYRFTEIIDWEKEELLISKETLVAFVDEYVEFVKTNPPSTEGGSGIYNYVDDDLLSMWQIYSDDYRSTGVLNDDAGYTAIITDYIAINRNAENPDTAYKFAELFFCDPIQQNQGFYDESIKDNSFDIHRPSGYGKLATGVNAYDKEGGFIDAQIEKINSARFYSEVEYTLTLMWQDVRNRALYEDIDADKVVDDVYIELRMIMAE